MTRPEAMRRALSALVGLALLAATPAVADVESAVRRAAGRNAVVFVVDERDRVLVDVDGGKSFLPASTIKLFTAFAALDELGPDFRFQTRFFLDGDELVVRGLGDPFLVSEELDVIVAALARRLAGRKLTGIVVDDSYFAPEVRIPGVGRTWNPYDAPNSATAVNFNTIGVERRGGRIVSAEEQTPLTPHAHALARGLRFQKALRFQIGHDPADVQRYVAELFAAKLRGVGIAVGDGVRSGRAPANKPPLYVHANSRTLAEVCKSMLASSNNFIANQIFLTLGAAALGAPARLDKSVRFARSFIAARPDLAGLHVVEGSGIAYENRAKGAAMGARCF